MANFVFIDNDRIRPGAGTCVVKSAEYAVIREPQQVLEDARAHAARIIKDSEAIYRSEKMRGFQEGLREGRQRMAEQIAATALRSDQHYRRLKEETIKLVMDIFKKVVQDLEPRELIVAQVEKALSAFNGSKQVVIKVHPARVEMLHDKLSEIINGCPGIEIIDIKAAPNLEVDHLILESEIGIVEASLEVQLAAIEEAFKKENVIMD